MPDLLLRRFGRFEDATRAVDQLLADGFAPAAIDLRSLEDEAGPVEGNFTVGNGRPATGARDDYEMNFADSAEPAPNLLAVEVADETQRARCAALLDGLGATELVTVPGAPGGFSRP